MNLIYIFLLIGQSNMVGMAQIPQCLPPVSNQIMVLGNDDVWKNYSDPYDSYINQVDMVSADLPPYEGGYSPARSFVTTLHDLHPNKRIAIIPAAKGASSIFQWQRNLSPTTLYGSALRRVNLALQKPKTVFAGIIFYQGEQEATSQYTSTLWASGFTQMVNDFRMDLNRPNLPVFFTKLPPRQVPHPWYPYWDQVRNNQMTVNIPNVTMVDVDDISMPNYTGIGTEYTSAHLTVPTYDYVGNAWANTVSHLIP